MRSIMLMAMLLALAGCAGGEYKDNTAAIARDPRCMDKQNNPDEEPAPWCKPAAGAAWSSKRKEEKIDFGGKPKDD